MFLFSANIIGNSANYINKISFQNPTWDIFLVLFFITLAFFYWVFVGKNKIVQMLVSSFFAFSIVKFNPFFQYFKNLNARDLSIINIILFVIFIVLFFILLSKKTISTNKASFLHVFLYSFLHIGLIIVLGLNLLEKSMLSLFGKTIQNVFINPIAFFVWIISSILALIFLKTSEED
jgi:hypothetical protein